MTATLVGEVVDMSMTLLGTGRQAQDRMVRRRVARASRPLASGSGERRQARRVLKARRFWACAVHLSSGVVAGVVLGARLLVVLLAMPLLLVSTRPMLAALKGLSSGVEGESERFGRLLGERVGSALQPPDRRLTRRESVSALVTDPRFGRRMIYALVRLPVSLAHALLLCLLLFWPALGLLASLLRGLRVWAAAEGPYGVASGPVMNSWPWDALAAHNAAGFAAATLVAATRK